MQRTFRWKHTSYPVFWGSGKITFACYEVQLIRVKSLTVIGNCPFNSTQQNFSQVLGISVVFFKCDLTDFVVWFVWVFCLFVFFYLMQAGLVCIQRIAPGIFLCWQYPSHCTPLHPALFQKEASREKLNKLFNFQERKHIQLKKKKPHSLLICD